MTNLPEEYMKKLYLRLQIAAENDDLQELYTLNEQNQYLFHGDASILWEENCLHVACKHGQLRFVKAVIKLNPQLTKRRNNDGVSPMHLASANGYVEIVQELAEFDPMLCLLEDRDSKLIPLHVAAMKGKEDVVTALVFACPESLHKLTALGQTVLHLALKNNQCGVFKVLVDELKRLKQEELLNRKDDEGNTVLHIAASHKLIEIVDLLISLHSSNGRVVQVNCVNERGYTPLDVHYENINDTVALDISQILNDAGSVELTPMEDVRYENFNDAVDDLDISQILDDAGSVEGSSLSNHAEQPTVIGSPMHQLRRLTMKTRNALLRVLVMIATATFTASWSLSGVFQPKDLDVGNGRVLNIRDMIFGPNPYKEIFYFVMFDMAVFLISMGVILVLVWPSFPCSTVLAFVSVTWVILYAIVVDKIMPQFFVLLGSSRISSTMFVWLSALAFIFCGVIVLFLIKNCLLASARFFKRPQEEEEEELPRWYNFIQEYTIT